MRICHQKGSSTKVKAAKHRTILIAGAGQLGSRYLQSLVNSPEPLEIHLLSLDRESLAMCARRWQEAGGDNTIHNIVNHLMLASIPAALDLVVVSSTAETRPELVEAIAKKCSVNFWVLEKVLARNAQGIARIDRAVSDAKGVWVNYYMRSQSLYRAVKERLATGQAKNTTVTGGDWGLACNALHFVHLHAWFNESPISVFDRVDLDSQWHAAKRFGNWEIHGELHAICQNGGRLQMIAKEGPTRYGLSIQCDEAVWEIIEEEGVARCSDGSEVVAKVAYQSSRPLLLDILSKGTCELPTLQDVMQTDIRFLELMLTCWRQTGHFEATYTPIT